MTKMMFIVAFMFSVSAKAHFNGPKLRSEVKVEEELEQVADPGAEAVLWLITTREQRATFVENKRNEVLNLLTNLVNNSRISTSARSKYSEVYSALKNAIIKWPDPGNEFKQCLVTNEGNGQTFKGCAAYAVISQGTMWLCNKILVQEYYVVETMIHEAAHLAGYGNECDATLIEYSALNHAGRTVYGNIYKCGFGTSATLK